LFVAEKIFNIPKNKKDPAWAHCHLDEDHQKVCNYCGKTIRGGGIHRIKEHLAHEKGQVEACKMSLMN
jgi:hypothetical protein